MTNVSQWVEQYGLLGVFLTAAAEGEIGVLVGGAMAHLGRLNPILVALAAWVGSFVSTQAFFHIGRSQRDGRWVRRIKKRRAFARAMKWIERRPRLFCFFYRFVYGFRVVGPVGISLSKVDARTSQRQPCLRLLWGERRDRAAGGAGPTVARMGQWFDWHDVLIIGGGATLCC